MAATLLERSMAMHLLAAGHGDIAMTVSIL